jgi:predicted lipoprotein
MLKKGMKYTLALGLLLVVGYNSVYFKKLNEVKAASASGKFDAAAYAQTFWREKLTPGLASATDLQQLLVLLQTDKESAFKKHSHALGIGNLRYFLVKGEGKITALNENDLALALQPDSLGTAVTIATEFIYGNAVRDALGLMDINDFSNTMDMNNVSAEINKKIRTGILPPFLAKARKGSLVQFTGALELNQQHLRLNKIEVIPISLKLVEAE